jgi:hypothetical protein
VKLRAGGSSGRARGRQRSEVRFEPRPRFQRRSTGPRSSRPEPESGPGATAVRLPHVLGHSRESICRLIARRTLVTFCAFHPAGVPTLQRSAARGRCGANTKTVVRSGRRPRGDDRAAELPPQRSAYHYGFSTRKSYLTGSRCCRTLRQPAGLCEAQAVRTPGDGRERVILRYAPRRGLGRS